MKTEIRPENEMKDSGIEYIGMIPKDWEVRKVCHLAEKVTDYVASGSFATLVQNVQYLDAPDYAQLIRTVDLSGSIMKQPVYVSKEAYEFLSNSNLFGGELILPNIGSVGCVYQYKKMYDYATLAPNAILLDMKENNRFYFYWFSNPIVVESLKMLGNSAVQVKFNKSQLRQYMLPKPSLSEQQAIADYLDEVCSKIDEIIAEAKASIEEYKELKQAVIFEAVTKGLDRNVEMKDSGYDFIGCIPAKWKMCKVRHLGILQNGISIGGEAFGNGYPFVSYGDVYRNYSLPKTVDKLVRSSEEDRKRYSVERGDWFFTRTSETIDEIGFSCVCEETILDAVFAGFLIRVRPFNGKIYTGFAKYYFRSKHLRSFFVKEMNLVTRASLAQGLLKDAPVVLPPYNEQVEIANYLENRCEIIDSVIENKESTIADLEAYKKSLIYELVTGKRRVV